MDFILPAGATLRHEGFSVSNLLVSSRPLLACWWFFSGSRGRCKRFPTPPGTFFAWWWLLPRWDIFCAWSVRCYNPLLLYNAGFQLSVAALFGILVALLVWIARAASAFPFASVTTPG